ncbi:MAG: hypothetical protein EAY81_04090 [Bacteroidetes bacterium]|nr:MAG: hypothetical protein EAY81_04090 [Bacteroidota bacterium]
MKINRIIYLVIGIFLQTCGNPRGRSSEKIIFGEYWLSNKKESITLLNDSVYIHKYYLNNFIKRDSGVYIKEYDSIQSMSLLRFQNFWSPDEFILQFDSLLICEYIVKSTQEYIIIPHNEARDYDFILNLYE